MTTSVLIDELIDKSSTVVFPPAGRVGGADRAFKTTRTLWLGGGNDGAKAGACRFHRKRPRAVDRRRGRAGWNAGWGDDAAHHEHGGVGLEASRNARVAELTAEVHNALYWDLAVPRDRVACIATMAG